MKKIIYTRPDGGLSVVVPFAGARLARKVLSAFGVVLYQSPASVPVERISRMWKALFGVEWAESEDEFLMRIVIKDVQVALTDSPQIVRRAMGADLPPDAPAPQMLPRAYAVKLGLGFVDPPHQVIEGAAVPVDRTFRDAWRAGAGRVEHDMEKCRDIHRARLRGLRKPLFEANDLSMRDAIAAKDDAALAAAIARRDALRYVTDDPAIESAATPEELKNVLPGVLK